MNVNYFYFKVLRAQLELGQVRQEIDRKIAEKEEEFENTRYVDSILFISQMYNFYFQQKSCPGNGLNASKS